ncbi:MAG: LamG domain-containing protein [Sphingobacteriales bacterium]|nr:MAG: LamG domain-containing protein [Sphingobacteriales bacterium]
MNGFNFLSLKSFMKRLLFALICVPFINVSAQTTYPSGVTGCIARYDFSTTGSGSTQLKDTSGNMHVGTTYNTVPTMGWRGRANTALGFDGSSSYVQIAHSPLLNPQNITMLGLVRFDNFYSGSCQANAIVSKGQPFRRSGTYGLYATDQVYDNNCSNFDPYHQVISGDLGTVSVPQYSMPNTVIKPNTWYFVAMVYNGTTIDFYQELMDSTTGLPTTIIPSQQVYTNGSMTSNTENLLLGKHANPSGPYWFNGAMDEVAIFNRGLTNAEILSIYKYLWNSTPLVVSNTVISENKVQARTENGRLFLESKDGKGIGSVVVYNIAGQKLMTGDYSNTQEVLDISTYPREILFVKVIRNGVVTTLKVSGL